MFFNNKVRVCLGVPWNLACSRLSDSRGKRKCEREGEKRGRLASALSFFFFSLARRRSASTIQEPGAGYEIGPTHTRSNTDTGVCTICDHRLVKLNNAKKDENNLTLKLNTPFLTLMAKQSLYPVLRRYKRSSGCSAGWGRIFTTGLTPGGGTPKNIGWGCAARFPIFMRSLQANLWSKSAIFPSLFMTWPYIDALFLTILVSKMLAKWLKSIPYFWPKRLKNPTLWAAHT